MIKGLFAKFFGTPAADSLNPKVVPMSTEDEKRLIELCSVPVQDALKALHADTRGLSSEAAEQRLNKFGPNELSHTKQLGFFADIFERCKSPSSSSCS